MTDQVESGVRQNLWEGCVVEVRGVPGRLLVIKEGETVDLEGVVEGYKVKVKSLGVFGEYRPEGEEHEFYYDISPPDQQKVEKEDLRILGTMPKVMTYGKMKKLARKENYAGIALVTYEIPYETAKPVDVEEESRLSGIFSEKLLMTIGDKKIQPSVVQFKEGSVVTKEYFEAVKDVEPALSLVDDVKDEPAAAPIEEIVEVVKTEGDV